ncbi:dipeptide ABC transporter ATP-binding protein [Gephyromycinifex aptenodytis]|uniref:dipeptide ABC transporter ATP-binding protein n=1 Tax=Gephyromycinifex aptenodytis TaxID=2716227 RepID=UPI0014478929|nr:ABC transporter ATP-binding protein [Gephyromycinifex aptenodytis]
MNTPALVVDGLDVYSDGRPLLSGIDLRIERGERVGLIGESGSGKSLTALSVLGLLPHTLHARGSIRVAGFDEEIVGASERHLARMRGKDVSMVFQEPLSALNPTMRVGDQIAEALLIHHNRPDRASAGQAAVELMEDMSIPEPAQAARAYPHQLSGGQRQRVMLAIALANDPALLVCDEPTTALDVTVQAFVLHRIVTSAAQRGSSVLFISHDLPVVATVCDRVYVMNEGRIVESGPTEQVLQRPTHPYTRRLLDASSLAPRQGHGAGEQARREHQQSAHARSQQNAAADSPRAPALPGAKTAAPGQEAREDRPASPVIQCSQVSRDYRRSRRTLFEAAPVVRALRNIDMTVQAGERVGIVGESGCGKSTLLRILAGLDRPSAGSVRIDGTDIAKLPERRLGFLRERLQLVFQDPMSSLDPRMRVRDIVAEPLVAQGRAPTQERIEELLTGVGLRPQMANRFPHQFSGGERQRISIARALSTDPGILLADEAVSALDVSVRAQVLDLLDSLVDRLGLTLVFVSHDLSVVRHVCDRVLVMRAGEIVESGPTGRIYDDPQHPYTQRLVAAIPTLERALRGAAPADLARLR